MRCLAWESRLDLCHICRCMRMQLNLSDILDTGLDPPTKTAWQQSRGICSDLSSSNLPTSSYGMPKRCIDRSDLHLEGIGRNN